MTRHKLDSLKDGGSRHDAPQLDSLEDGGPVWCYTCERWLNGPDQMEEHLIRKKHKKCRRRIQHPHHGKIPADKGADLDSVHPFYGEAVMAGVSLASHRIDELGRSLPAEAVNEALLTAGRIRSQVRRSKRVRNAYAQRIVALQQCESPNPSGGEDKVCAFCGTSDRRCKRCSGCYTTRYCSRVCQTAHWRVHRSPCKRLFMEDHTIGEDTVENTSSMEGGRADEDDDDASWTLTGESTVEEADEDGWQAIGIATHDSRGASIVWQIAALRSPQSLSID